MGRPKKNKVVAVEKINDVPICALSVDIPNVAVVVDYKKGLVYFTHRK